MNKLMYFSLSLRAWCSRIFDSLFRYLVLNIIVFTKTTPLNSSIRALRLIQYPPHSFSTVQRIIDYSSSFLLSLIVSCWHWVIEAFTICFFRTKLSVIFHRGISLFGIFDRTWVALARWLNSSSTAKLSCFIKVKVFSWSAMGINSMAAIRIVYIA